MYEKYLSCHRFGKYTWFNLFLTKDLELIFLLFNLVYFMIRFKACIPNRKCYLLRDPCPGVVFDGPVTPRLLLRRVKWRRRRACRPVSTSPPPWCSCRSTPRSGRSPSALCTSSKSTSRSARVSVHIFVLNFIVSVKPT